jgi:imidazolonepropionase-like amidohydrolase
MPKGGATQILFTDVHVFDGCDSAGSGSVLVENNQIKEVAIGGNATLMDVWTNATRVMGGGRTLMPGLIDMHSHLMLDFGLSDFYGVLDGQAAGALASRALLDYLQQGFTTTRDIGGNSLSIARLLKNHRLTGPRVWSVGPTLSHVGSFNELPTQPLENGNRHGAIGWMVHGRDAVLTHARWNFRNGAVSLKLMAGSDMSSAHDPIHMAQFLPDEMRAAVEVAEQYNSYVSVHAYTDRSVNIAIDVGVKCIEHGFLISNATLDRMVAEGVALSVQAVMSLEAFADPESITFYTPQQVAKAKLINAGARAVLPVALDKGVLLVAGGDMYGSAYVGRQADNLRILKTVGYPNRAILRMATGDAAVVLGWSNEMSPHQDRDIGVIQPGAFADIILVDGNPLEDIDALRRDRVLVVVKDGVVYKNML